MLKALIIYGSASGNTELVCQHVANLLEENRFRISLVRAKKASSKQFDQADLIILAAPTYEHGLLEYNMRRFIDGLGDIDLKKRHFAVIGLGDDTYDSDYHMESAQILGDFVQNHGGNLLFKPLKISKSPIGQLEGTVREWAEDLIRIIKKAT